MNIEDIKIGDILRGRNGYYYLVYGEQHDKYLRTCFEICVINYPKPLKAYITTNNFHLYEKLK